MASLQSVNLVLYISTYTRICNLLGNSLRNIRNELKKNKNREYDMWVKSMYH